MAHREHHACVAGLLVDQVEQIVGTRVVEPLLEAHRVITGCHFPECGTYLFPGLAGTPRRGTQHPVRRNAAVQQPPAGRAGIATATGGQRALDVVDPWLALRLGMPKHQKRAASPHRVPSLTAEVWLS